MENEAFGAEFGALTEEESVGVMGGDKTFVEDLFYGIGVGIARTHQLWNILSDSRIPIDFDHM